MNPAKPVSAATNQPKHKAFQAAIQKLLKKYRTNNGGKGLLWISESESPVKFIRFHHLLKKFWGWKEETNKESIDRLTSFVEANDGGSGERELAALLMSQDTLVSFTRKHLFGAGSDLYIVVAFGGQWYVGVKTELIET